MALSCPSSRPPASRAGPAPSTWSADARVRAAALVAILLAAFIGVMFLRFSGDTTPAPAPTPSPPEADQLFSLPWFDAQLIVRSEARLGETIPLAIRLQNLGGRTVTLNVGLGPQDFVVRDVDGREVWSWRFGSAVPALPEKRTFAPREEVDFEGEWDLVNNRDEPVPPGTYFVQGVMRVERGWMLQTKTSELTLLP